MGLPWVNEFGIELPNATVDLSIKTEPVSEYDRTAFALWKNQVERDCLLEADGDVEAALSAASYIVATTPHPEESEIDENKDAPLSLDAAFAFDIHNRKAQGILNRALKVVRGMSDAAKRDLAEALERGGTGSGEAVLNFVDKYRVQLAHILTTTELAALLEGAQEVAGKVPPLGEVPVDGLPVVEQERILEARRRPLDKPIETPEATGLPEDVHLVTIDEAVKNLQARKVLDKREYDAISAAARAKAFTVANVQAQETLVKIRDSLAKNVQEGADYATWRKKVLAEVGPGTFMSDQHQEVVFRTNVQTAFSDGQAAVLSHPLVRSGFPYSTYDAIHDDRVRANHLALESLGIQGTNVYRNDDPVFQLFRPPWDYSDRCGWTPITVRHAAELGIKEAQDWLRTGVEPAAKAHVPMPKFRPPEGFARSVAAAPLSIQMSLQPTMSFAGFDEKDHPREEESGKFTKKDGGKKPFYSKLGEALRGLGSKLISAASVYNRVKKAGVTDEEWHATKMPEVLEGSQMVDPSDLVRHQQTNNIIPTDVWKKEHKGTSSLPFSEKTIYHQYQTPGGDNYKELLLTLPASGHTKDVATVDYKSPHWVEPNIVAHVRMNDRQADNGEKILHIEEVQSDWHQAGREHGYMPLPTNFSQRISIEPNGGQYGGFRVYDKHKEANGRLSTLDWAATEEEAKDKLVNTIKRLEEEEKKEHRKFVPQAPFKESWPTLALKRVLHHAAENNYNRLTVNSGKQIQSLVGGEEEGQSEFYDKTIPNILKKLGKPFGVGVEEYVLNSDTKQRIDHYQKMMDEARIEGKSLNEKIKNHLINDSKHGSRGSSVESKMHDMRNGPFAHLDDMADLYELSRSDVRRYRELHDNLTTYDIAIRNLRKDHTPVTTSSLPITPKMRAEILDKGFALSIELTQPEEELAFAHDVSGEKRDEGGRWTVGGSGGRKERGEASNRVKKIITEAEAIPITSDVYDTQEEVGLRDYDEIEERMTQDEIVEMNEALSNIRDEVINSDMEYFVPDVKERDVAENNDLSGNDIEQEADRLFGEHGLVAPNLTGRDYGVLGIDKCIESLDEDATQELRDALEEWREEVESDMERYTEIERESQEESYREDFNNNYNDSEDRSIYLRQFHRDHGDRYQGKSEAPLNSWGVDKDGDGVYYFETASSKRYEIVAAKKKVAGHEVADLSFSDDGGNYSVTGKGDALEVFSKVVPAMVAYIKKKGLTAVTFSAAEESRQKLYDTLVRSVTAATPGYFAASTDVGSGGSKYYVIGKVAMKEDLLSYVKQKMSVEPKILVEGISASLGVADSAKWVELLPTVDPAWFTEEYWAETPSKPTFSLEEMQTYIDRRIEAALGTMVDGVWHGPRPPSNTGWVETKSGPRGGKRWVQAGTRKGGGRSGEADSTGAGGEAQERTGEADGAVADKTPGSSDAQAGGVGEGAGQPARDAAAGNARTEGGAGTGTETAGISRKEAAAKLDAISDHLNDYIGYFNKAEDYDTAGWLDLIKSHINTVGADAALNSLLEEPSAREGVPQGRVQYLGTTYWEADDDQKFLKKYLDECGIVIQGTNVPLDPNLPLITSAPMQSAARITTPATAPVVHATTTSNLTDKLIESKALPGLESTEDIGVIMGRPVEAFTPDVMAKLDEKYGAGKWIVKSYGEEAYAGFGVFFPEFINKIRDDARKTLFDTNERLKKHGYKLAQDEDRKVVGIASEDGTVYNFNSDEIATIPNKWVRRYATVARMTAPDAEATRLPTTPEDNFRQKTGITMYRNSEGKITGVIDQLGRAATFGTPEYDDFIERQEARDIDIEHDVERVVTAAESGSAPAKFFAQPAFPTIGVTEEERAAGLTWETSHEGRVHVVTRNGRAEVIPYATLARRGDALPAVFLDDDLRAMQDAAQHAINALPESERTGQVYAPDVMKTADGWKVVEVNASDVKGQSLWLEENALVIDAYVSHITGHEPAHAKFVRNLLRGKTAKLPGGWITGKETKGLSLSHDVSGQRRDKDGRFTEEQLGATKLARHATLDTYYNTNPSIRPTGAARLLKLIHRLRKNPTGKDPVDNIRYKHIELARGHSTLEGMHKLHARRHKRRKQKAGEKAHIKAAMLHKIASEAHTTAALEHSTVGEVDWRPTETIPEDYYAFSFDPTDHPRGVDGAFVFKGRGEVRTVRAGGLKATYTTHTDKSIGGPHLNLKNYRQQDEHSCGFVAALTISRFFDKDVESHEVLTSVRAMVNSGVSRHRMVAALRKLGVEAEYRDDLTITKLKKCIERGRPTIVSIWPDEWDTDHWTVVQGFGEDNRVYLTNHRSLPLQQFKKEWTWTEDGHVKDSGVGLVCRKMAARGGQALAFDPDQPRDTSGEWTSRGGSGFKRRPPTEAEVEKHARPVEEADVATKENTGWIEWISTALRYAVHTIRISGAIALGSVFVANIAVTVLKHPKVAAKINGMYDGGRSAAWAGKKVAASPGVQELLRRPAKAGPNATMSTDAQGHEHDKRGRFTKSQLEATGLAREATIKAHHNTDPIVRHSKSSILIKQAKRHWGPKDNRDLMDLNRERHVIFFKAHNELEKIHNDDADILKLMGEKEEVRLHKVAAKLHKAAAEAHAVAVIEHSVAGEVDWRPTETLPEDYYASLSTSFEDEHPRKESGEFTKKGEGTTARPKHYKGDVRGQRRRWKQRQRAKRRALMRELRDMPEPEKVRRIPKVVELVAQDADVDEAAAATVENTSWLKWVALAAAVALTAVAAVFLMRKPRVRRAMSSMFERGVTALVAGKKLDEVHEATRKAPPTQVIPLLPAPKSEPTPAEEPIAEATAPIEKASNPTKVRERKGSFPLPYKPEDLAKAYAEDDRRILDKVVEKVAASKESSRGGQDFITSADLRGVAKQVGVNTEGMKKRRVYDAVLDKLSEDYGAALVEHMEETPPETAVEKLKPIERYKVAEVTRGAFDKPHKLDDAHVRQLLDTIPLLGGTDTVAISKEYGIPIRSRHVAEIHKDIQTTLLARVYAARAFFKDAGAAPAKESKSNVEALADALRKPAAYESASAEASKDYDKTGKRKKPAKVWQRLASKVVGILTSDISGGRVGRLFSQEVLSDDVWLSAGLELD